MGTGSFDKQLQWALSQSNGSTEHVNMPAFAKKFNYTQAKSAEEPYLKVIKSSNISLARQRRLMKEYKTFKVNEAKQYWESVQFKLSLKSTARKAAVSTAEAGLYELQAEYSTYKEGSADQSSECIDLSPSSEPSRTSPKTSLLQEQKSRIINSGSSSTVSSVSGAASSLPTSSPGKKRRVTIRTEDPWHDLTVSLTKIVNGQKTDIPSSTPNMTRTATVLFNHAVDLLDEYQQQMPDRKDTTLVKDAQVAMSCLLNTMSPRAVSHFMLAKEDELIADATDSTTLPYFEEHECLKYARAYCAVLEEHGLEYLLRKLAIDRGQLFSSHPLDEPLPKAVVIKEKVLRVLEKLCHFALRPPFGSSPPSENDCLQLWLEIFGIITDKVTIHRFVGEKVLEASKIMRNQQAVEFGDLSDSGRKVDLIFSYGEVELSNIEFKRQDISPKDITVQCRKNIRLGRCIQELHKSYGIKDPAVMMADVVGYVGFFYLVKPFKEVSVAGKTTQSMVILPNTAGAMEVFLESASLAMIWNYLDFLERQGPKVAMAKERTDAKQGMASVEQAIASSHPCTPPPKERDFSNTVTFSPSKKRSQKAAGLD